MDTLIAAYMIWASSFTGLPAPETPPRVRTASACDIQQAVVPDRPCSGDGYRVVAYYEKGTIWLPDDRDWTPVQRVRGRLGLDQRPYFLFLGAIEPRKNIKNLVDAFELALDQGLEADLVLAGPHGWQSRRIREACARRTRLQRRLHLPGYIAPSDLPPLMAGACGFVHPARHEGTGMTAMEAMAAGTPVLCSHRGALPEVTAGAALLFEPNDPASIARTLLQTEP